MNVGSRSTPRRCDVVLNRTKVSDELRSLEAKGLDRDGWSDRLWLETTAEDSGRAMTQTAVKQQPDLVMAAGGDGTVRLVADGLAHTGIPTGLIPAGTREPAGPQPRAAPG
jgi:diacylglycerol kinase family enzyme